MPRSIAASSRSRARVVGFCRDHGFGLLKLDLVHVFHRGRAADVDGWLRDDAFEGLEPSAHDDEVRSFCLTYDDPIPVAVFEAWLTALVHFQGPNLLRVKVIVRLAELDQPAVVHFVQHAFHPPITLPEWPSSDRRTRIVFIARGIEKRQVRTALDRVLDAQGTV